VSAIIAPRRVDRRPNLSIARARGVQAAKAIVEDAQSATPSTFAGITDYHRGDDRLE
jgi:hypothetical protein